MSDHEENFASGSEHGADINISCVRCFKKKRRCVRQYYGRACVRCLESNATCVPRVRKVVRKVVLKTTTMKLLIPQMDVVGDWLNDTFTSLMLMPSFSLPTAKKYAQLRT
jgi:hypothetical protein